MILGCSSRSNFFNIASGCIVAIISRYHSGLTLPYRLVITQNIQQAMYTVALTASKQSRYYSAKMIVIILLPFTHSSRRAWSLLGKLGGATHSRRQQPKVTANEAAHQYLLNGSIKKDREQAKHILKQQCEALSDCPETSNSSQAFTTDEIINALKATKAGKAAGPDGIFPDMLKNIRPSAMRLLQAFYDDVVTTVQKYGDQQM